MNDLLNAGAEGLESNLGPHKRRPKDPDDQSLDESDETETISIHVQCRAENSDDLLRLCGDAGIWQIMIFLLGSFFGFNCSMQNFIYLFIADTPEYFCSFPEVDSSLYTEAELKSLLLPIDPLTGMVDKCHRYKSDVVNGTITYVYKNITEVCNTDSIPVQFENENHDFAETIGTEYSLVCNLAFWIPSVEATYMIGVLVGSIFFGILSDKYGRRRTIWIALFVFIISAPLVALSTNFVTLLIFRFFLGTSSPGIYSTAYVLVVEAIGSKRRGLAGSLYSIPYSLGYMVLPIIAYFVREWRTLQLTCASCATLMIMTWWYIPESPRWLLLKGRLREAEELFREIARVNDKKLPKDFHELVKKVAYAERESKHEITCDQRCRNCMHSCCKCAKTPVLRFRVFCMSVAFVAISLVYYGIAINPTNLGFDRYLFTFLCGLFEIPAEVTIATLIESRGRRLVFSGFFLLCGTFLLLSLIFSRGSVVNIILFVTAQLFISGNSTLIYLYSAEMFPTEMRGYCLGISSMVGRIGGIAVPFIVELVGEKHKNYPTIIFGVTSLSAGALALLLPETRNKKMPDTVLEVEQNK